MAQRVITEMIDDLDNTPGDDVETYHFLGLNGVAYEIDLRASNAAKFDEALAPFVEVARVLRRVRSPRRKAGPVSPKGQGHFTPADHGTTPNDIREWAKTNGLSVHDRGAIPGWLGQAWLAANAPSAP